MANDLVQRIIKRIPLLRDTYQIASGATKFFAVILGTAGVAAVWQWIEGNPAFALAGSAVFVYYALVSYSEFTAVTSRSDLSFALVFNVVGFNFIARPDGKFDVSLNFQIINAIDQRIVLLIEHEHFSIENISAKPPPPPAIQVVHPRSQLGQRTGVMPGVEPPHDSMRCRLDIRFGVVEKTMNYRWTFEADVYLLAPIANGDHASLGGFNVITNRFDRLEQ